MSAKQAINDKLQGSVDAGYCDRFVTRNDISRAKTDEPIELLFGGHSRGPTNHVLTQFCTRLKTFLFTRVYGTSP